MGFWKLLQNRNGYGFNRSIKLRIIGKTLQSSSAEIVLINERR